MNAPVNHRTIGNMTRKGQVLIPKAIRDAVGLSPGGRVRIEINDRGEAIVAPEAPAELETRAQRVERLMRGLDDVRSRYATGRTTEEIMEFLRGDEPLP